MKNTLPDNYMYASAKVAVLHSLKVQFQINSYLPNDRLTIV